MKIHISMKDPDCLYDCINEDVKAQLRQNETLSEEEREILLESRREAIRKELVSKWFEYGEYLNLEYDTEAKTLTILARK